jgi:hypothetical protein
MIVDKKPKCEKCLHYKVCDERNKKDYELMLTQVNEMVSLNDNFSVSVLCRNYREDYAPRGYDAPEPLYRRRDMQGVRIDPMLPNHMPYPELTYNDDVDPEAARQELNAHMATTNFGHPVTLRGILNDAVDEAANNAVNPNYGVGTIEDADERTHRDTGILEYW